MGLEQRFSAIRKEKKMSQQELADMVGIHPNVLGRYELGEVLQSIVKATILANALEVFLDYLVGNTDLELDKSLVDKVVSIQQLPDEDKTSIIYSLDGLVKYAKTRLAYK